jgi:putative addiction module killer protein
MPEVRQTENFARWLAGLRDKRARARINARIRRMSLGNPGEVKPVGGGLAAAKRLSSSSRAETSTQDQDIAMSIKLAGGL